MIGEVVLGKRGQEKRPGHVDRREDSDRGHDRGSQRMAPHQREEPRQGERAAGPRIIAVRSAGTGTSGPDPDHRNRREQGERYRIDPAEDRRRAEDDEDEEIGIDEGPERPPGAARVRVDTDGHG